MKNNEVESFEHAGRTVTIYIDDDPINPRKDYDNLATFACWHRRMNLGDEKIEGCSKEEIYESVSEEIFAILPLYLYQHSGLTISTEPFGCRFDSGQVGWAYVTKSSAEAMGCVGDRFTQADGETVKVGTWDEAALQVSIRSEVETYDQYLRGEAYGYEVTGTDGDALDSCWGFIGDLDYVRSEAKSAAEHVEDPAVEREVEAMASRATLAGYKG
jgi:hypothetical protein